MIRQIKSHWDVDIQGKFIKGQNNTLCIILPGVGYLLDRSYLDYSKQLAQQLNYNILEIEYGFQIARKDFSIPDEFQIALEETLKLIDLYLDKNYDKFVIIGKSIGTSIQVFLNKHLKNKNISNIYISPIDKTVDLGITENSLVIAGLADPLLSADNLNKIKKINGINLVTIKDAVHSLNIKGDVIRSIDELKRVIEIEKDFLK